MEYTEYKVRLEFIYGCFIDDSKIAEEKIKTRINDMLFNLDGLRENKQPTENNIFVEVCEVEPT